jgi:hypothetical protein
MRDWRKRHERANDHGTERIFGAAIHRNTYQIRRDL